MKNLIEVLLVEPEKESSVIRVVPNNTKEFKALIKAESLYEVKYLIDNEDTTLRCFYDFEKVEISPTNNQIIIEDAPFLVVSQDSNGEYISIKKDQLKAMKKFVPIFLEEELCTYE